MKSAEKLMILITLLLILSGIYPVMAQDLVNMEFKQAPLVEIFQILGQLGGYNVLVDPVVKGDISFALNDLTVEEALDLVTRTTGYRYKLMGNTLVISSDQRLKSEFGNYDFTFVAIEHVDIQASQRLLNLVLPEIKSHVDSELNLIVLYGLTTDLEIAKRILRQYDQKSYIPITIAEPDESIEVPIIEKPVEIPEEIPVFENTITIRYTDGARILETLQQLWPEREFRLDSASQTIIGLITVDEWTLISELILELDLPDFRLKGLLESAHQIMVLVEYRGVTTLLEPGQSLFDWELNSVEDGVAEFRQGQRRIAIGMGR